MIGALIALFFVYFGLDNGTSAATHNLVVGTFSTEFLYTVEYNDETESLTLVAQSAVAAASSWITLNVNIALRSHGRSCSVAYTN